MLAPILTPMTEAGYAAYLKAAVASHSDDEVLAGRSTKEAALQHSQDEFAQMLPQGASTPDNHLYDIRDAASGEAVGVLWFAQIFKSGVKIAYVYDLEIQPEQRRKGHARAAFTALEVKAMELGLPSIGLHVFAHSPGAKALYESLGYGVTGFNMLKRLGERRT